MQSKLNSIISSVSQLNSHAMDAARMRQAQLAKPPGSLGILEDLSVQLAGITGSIHNELKKKHLIVFASDNGVVDEGISSAPQSVTLQQTINLTHGKTGAAVLAKHVGCDITVCDVGVNADINEPRVINRKIAYGTGNIAIGPAMTKHQTLKAIITGAELVESIDADVFGTGEMGIGNTTTSSAVLAVLLDADVESVTGRGGGITDDGFKRKKQIIKKAIDVNKPDKTDVIDVLAKVGGFDIAAMCGAFLGAAATRKPVVIDGFISAVAALCAVRLCPYVREYLIPSHESYEIGYQLAMDAMLLKPMLRLNMRLGEGSGCPLAFEILDAACAIMNNMATFEQAGIDDEYLEEIRQGDKFTHFRIKRPNMGTLILVSGENNSGKSAFAEKIVGNIKGEKFYIATMIPQTDENHLRIEKHRNQRNGLGFCTLELPYMVGEAPVTPESAVLLEDISNLMANNIFEKGNDENFVFQDICKLLKRCSTVVAVTISGLNSNDYDEETSRYISSLNKINKMLFDAADIAVSMHDKTPVYEKGEPYDFI